MKKLMLLSVMAGMFVATQAFAGEDVNTASGEQTINSYSIKGIEPISSPFIHTHSVEITQRLSSILNERLHLSSKKTFDNGRVYHLPVIQTNVWVQGIYGNSKYSKSNGWNIDSRSAAMGFDGFVDEETRVGVAYAYSVDDGKVSGRNVDVDSHTIVMYGQYNPDHFYANWFGMYTKSNYTEKKHFNDYLIKAKYNVDAYSAQAMFGYKTNPVEFGEWVTGVFKPEVGARYVYTKQKSYTDWAGQTVGEASGNSLTAVMGAQYGIGYTLDEDLTWYPELRAALTYDLITPNTKSAVYLFNGNAYEVKTSDMKRLGLEVGARVGMDIDKTMEMALEYEGVFKGDYKNHTGLASLKYKF